MKTLSALRSAALSLGLALSITSTPASACGFCSPTYNDYIFRVGTYSTRTNYETSVDRALLEAWNEYAHCHLAPEDVEALRTLRPDDVTKLDHPVLNYMRAHSDKEMQVYLFCLAGYLEAVAEGGYYDAWDYPSQEDVAEQKQKLRKVLNMVKMARPTKYADRFRLLHMRLLYRLGDYAACDRLWAERPIGEPANVFERMTSGFYAASLFARDRRDDAARIYAVIGDAVSARFCMNNRGSVSYMQSVVDTDPASPVLPFMVENFINSLQETHDVSHAIAGASDEELEEEYFLWGYCGYDRGSNYYSRDFLPMFRPELFFNSTYTSHFADYGTFAVAPHEVDAFMDFSAEMLERPDVADPILWRTARAYIYYMRGQHDEAWQEINKPSSRPSPSAHVADCERLIRLLIATTLTDETQMEKAVGDLLPWLRSKVKAEAVERNREREIVDWTTIQDPHVFWQNAYYRILVHGLARHYAKAGDLAMEQLCYFLVSADTSAELVEAYPNVYPSFRFYEAGDDGIFTDNFAALSVEQQAAVYNDLFGKRRLTAFQKGLMDGTQLEATDFIDYIGTHCLLLGRWEQAESWLKQVPLSYISKQHIAQYAAQRKYTTELWFRHVRVDYEPWDGHYDEETDEWVPNVYPAPVFKSNPKVDFCRDVMRLEKEVKKSKGEARCQKAYELATILAQASAHGDCWWLGRWKTSVGTFASESAYEPQDAYKFGAEALRMADIALTTTDPALRSRALMARLYMLNDGRDEYVYDEEEGYGDWVNVVNPLYTKTADDLCRFLRANRGAYDARISNCDVVVDMLRGED